MSVERLEDGSTLDSTSMSCTCLHSAPARASTSAGQAADDDVEEGNNGIDNGLEDSGNGVNNCHDAVADGPEDGLDAGNDGAHVDGCVCLFLVLEMVEWMWLLLQRRRLWGDVMLSCFASC